MMKYKETHKEEFDWMKEDGYNVEKFFEFGEARKSKSNNPTFGRRKK
jgi:hypothetical protein